MDIKTTLEYISVQNKYRQTRITDILEQNHIAYNLETTNPNIYTNIIIQNNEFVNPNMKILISAHYDAVKNSNGANDNGAAVAMLLKLAEHIQTHKTHCPIDIALFDREESGFIGSNAYVNKNKALSYQQPIFFINCDVIGCGDGIVMVKHDRTTSYPTASSVLSTDFIKKYNITEYNRFPPSDAYNLSRNAKWNGIEFSVFPQKDIDNHTSIEIFNYMHNAKYDNISFINYDMIYKLYQAIIELICVNT